MFIVRAVGEKLALLEQTLAVEQAAGAWQDADYPEFSDNDAIDSWLDKLRS
ncbi:MAG: hypothetical protein M9930_18840 [Anaerolineae bacterium]|nr:hypothetical protein [Anaerolineae bacterium]